MGRARRTCELIAEFGYDVVEFAEAYSAQGRLCARRCVRRRPVAGMARGRETAGRRFAGWLAAGGDREGGESGDLLWRAFNAAGLWYARRCDVSPRMRTTFGCYGSHRDTSELWPLVCTG